MSFLVISFRILIMIEDYLSYHPKKFGPMCAVCGADGLRESEFSALAPFPPPPLSPLDQPRLLYF